MWKGLVLSFSLAHFHVETAMHEEEVIVAFGVTPWVEAIPCAMHPVWGGLKLVTVGKKVSRFLFFSLWNTYRQTSSPSIASCSSVLAKETLPPITAPMMYTNQVNRPEHIERKNNTSINYFRVAAVNFGIFKGIVFPKNGMHQRTETQENGTTA